MNEIRTVKLNLKSKPTIEGAGVRLRRVFGYADSSLDPFLLLDDFSSDNPTDYLPGFPWHPHRGIETITYILKGKVEHGDSLGNGGTIGTGEVQWMTAGSGIIHQEMPKNVEDDPSLAGFQLWANLPATHKMMDPRYRDLKQSDIPEVKINDKIKVKIISGTFNGTQGPVQDIITDPEYLDVAMQPFTKFMHSIRRGYNVIAYTFEGAAYFDNKKERLIGTKNLVIFNDGEEILVNTKDKPVRFLLISGKPIREPVAWSGPIVMNTEEELRVAFDELQRGTFIKHKRK
jgi:redox-sensitive bicupin YhaK (pirin superfamily)